MINHERNALTLIELLVSLAISSMLLMTVMGMSMRMAKSSKLVRDQHPIEAWQEILKETLQADYSSARSIIVEPNRIVIQGLVKPDVLSAEENHLLPLPGIIIYSINTLDEISVLTRTVRPLVRASTESPASDLMATGIIGFRTLTPLPTDVAPGGINLRIISGNEEEPMSFSLVRHGMPE